VKVVIDHRAYPDLSRMKGAVTWIDRVGAAATLVGELYQGQGVKPDDRCAQILYAAIMSNTVGLSSRNTTDRDRAMADYLAHAGKFDSKFVEEMFRHKSEMDEPLYNRIDEDLSTKNQRMGEYICSIAQLEINDVEQVLVERRDELNDALEKLKEERGADQIFLIGIDLRSKKTFFHFLDPVMQVLIASKFPLRPRGRLSFLDHVVTRKDVIAAFNTTDEMSASVSQ
jgi:manganese-dependent inorganic pyrophosphatase